MTNIIMLVRDRYRLTEQALTTLRANTEEYTLTIVDDGSEDFRVRKMLAAEARKPRTSLLTLLLSSHVLARTKNIGVLWSEMEFGRGDYLYLSDNDVAFMPGWLPALQRFAGIGSHSLTGGQVHPFHKPPYTVLDGPSWLMEWHTWDTCGPLNRNCAPGVCQSEEYEFCANVIKHGGTIGVIDPHVVIHTGLSQTDGKMAPGAAERAARKIEGVLYE
jgi:hypothetical protein